MMERKNYIDILRGIAIIFVVFAHVTRIFSIRTYFFSFHVPLFFFISGMVFYAEKYRDFRDFFIKKLKSLIIPHCIFYLLTFLYWIFIEKNYRGADISPVSQMIGLIYGSNNTTYMYFNEALWFLPCLFTTGTLYFFINKITSKWIKTVILIVIYMLGILLINKSVTGLPWGGNIALCACLFYGAGHLFRDKIIQVEKQWSLKYSLFSVVIIIFCGILQFFIADSVTLDMAELQITVLSIPVSLTGIVLYLALALSIKKNKILEFFGKNSLIIFALQGPIYRAVIFLYATIVKQATDWVRQDLFSCILITIIAILLSMPFIVLYNRFIAPQLRKL